MIGIYGGTFDPIHRGHLAVARAAREVLDLDRVVLVPAGQPPHKGHDLASGDDRLAMARLAVADEAGLEVSDCELRRGGISYTIDTLESFASLYPEADLCFILGADSVPELKTWKRLGDILSIARIIAIQRSGHEMLFRREDFPNIPANLLDRCRADRVTMPPVDVSSTQVRRALGQGLDTSRLLPRPVAEFILRRGLYRP